MTDINVDINETEIFNLYPEVLTTLLKDHTTGQNIFWATDSYAYMGEGFQYKDAITIEHIIGKNGMVIRPRSLKSKNEQTERTKEITCSEVLYLASRYDTTTGLPIELESSLLHLLPFLLDSCFSVHNKINLNKSNFMDNNVFLRKISYICSES